jgi:propionate CoA-transferase
LSIENEGKHQKFVKEVGQVTFSGARAAREGRKVYYVTERCVFRLVEGGMELIEIAPGIDLRRDILRHLPFDPIIINTPQQMPDVLFRPERMGLQRLISKLGLDRRISYNPDTNMLFLDFSGMRINTISEVTRVRDGVEAVLKPLAQKVDAIINYDGFWVNPEISDKYMEAVHYIQSRYYHKASRFTTNGFARIQLAKGLNAHQVHSGVVGNFTEAKLELREN